MAEHTPEYHRHTIVAWLDTAEEDELIEVLELIQVLLTRRRLRGPRPEAPPAPESDQEN
jgi:hypothetical protein